MILLLQRCKTFQINGIQWDPKYNSLLQNVDSISPNDLVFIKEDLNIAKDSWKNIKDYAEKIYAEDIKVVDTKSIIEYDSLERYVLMNDLKLLFSCEQELLYPYKENR